MKAQKIIWRHSKKFSHHGASSWLAIEEIDMPDDLWQSIRVEFLLRNVEPCCYLCSF